MAELPAGTVTFLFTDIEGSTKLLQRLGDGYAEVLAAHQRLLRAAIADHSGVEVDTQGDSFFVAFPRATDALAAAAEATRALAAYPWPPNGMVRVRMGLHTGTPHLSKDGLRYVGIDVNRAARIAAAGHGGQILLSQTTRDQVAKELVAGEGIRDLGKHRLKDLPRREELYQLVLSGLPADYPPLKTLDAWPGLRADLVSVVLISAVLLAAAGLALAQLVTAFPRWIGLGAAGLAVLLVLASSIARPLRRALVSQWRDARKPFAAITSTLLSLVVVTTTLFITKPPIFIKPAHLGYDFSYTYHAPTKTGGAITIGASATCMNSLAPLYYFTLNGIQNGTLPCPTQAGDNPSFLYDTCLVQLPDLSLGLPGWKPDICTEVPTVVNGGESADYKTTTFHIDPRAVWSDGVPVTATDFQFAEQLRADPNIIGGTPWSLMTLSAPDEHTVQIHWSIPYADYLPVLSLTDVIFETSFYPLPWHLYASGPYGGAYDPATGRYNSALAQQLVQSDSFNDTLAADNGPFTVQSFVPESRLVLVKNPRFFSNFFHHPPALDQVTLLSPIKADSNLSHWASDVLASYQQGELTMADGLDARELSHLGAIPKSEVISSPTQNFRFFGFNQRSTAPSAVANGGISPFTDPLVRKAFVEAFDRCSAVRAQLGITNCTDPNLFSDELTVPPAVDYDPTFHLPSYNPTDAAALLDKAGYPVVDGVRRGKDGTTPLQLTFILSFASQDLTAIATTLQQDFAKNVQVSVTIIGPDQYPKTNPAVSGNFDIFMFADQAPVDPVDKLAGADSADIPPNGGNYLGIIDPKAIQQDQLGSQTEDADQRAAVYKALTRYWSEQFYDEPVFVDADVTLAKPSVCNFKKWPQAFNNLWNIADWYVAPSCPT